MSLLGGDLCHQVTQAMQATHTVYLALQVRHTPTGTAVQVLEAYSTVIRNMENRTDLPEVK